MRTTTTITLACIASAAVLAGCSDKNPGTPGATSTAGTPIQSSAPQSNAPTGLPHSGAPAVANPVEDTAKWEADPCSAISAAQFSSIGLKAEGSGRGDNTAVSVCKWDIDLGFGSGVSGGFLSNAEGLSQLYKRNTQGDIAVFTVLPPIKGYPAVRAEDNDESGDGLCATTVGVRDDKAFDVIVTLDADTTEAKDPCKVAQAVAGLAIQTMTGGA